MKFTDMRLKAISNIAKNAPENDLQMAKDVVSMFTDLVTILDQQMHKLMDLPKTSTPKALQAFVFFLEFVFENAKPFDYELMSFMNCGDGGGVYCYYNGKMIMLIRYGKVIEIGNDTSMVVTDCGYRWLIKEGEGRAALAPGHLTTPDPRGLMEDTCPHFDPNFMCPGGKGFCWAVEEDITIIKERMSQGGE